MIHIRSFPGKEKKNGYGNRKKNQKEEKQECDFQPSPVRGSWPSPQSSADTQPELAARGRVLTTRTSPSQVAGRGASDHQPQARGFQGPEGSPRTHLRGQCAPEG